jgi:hypothetical protein
MPSLSVAIWGARAGGHSILVRTNAAPACPGRGAEMGDHDDAGVPNPEHRELVVVPHEPGALIPFALSARPRQPDALDELIDDLFPAVEEHTGWFDVALVAVGAGLLGWAAVATAPTIAVVVGVLAVTLGCVLPARGAWRRARHARDRRRREHLLRQGILLDISSPATATLAHAYEELIALPPRCPPDIDDPSISAAHIAVQEVATLLRGRAPDTDREIEYIELRMAAVSRLVAALRTQPTPGASREAQTDAVLDARAERDRFDALSSVARLEELTAEARIQRRGRT